MKETITTRQTAIMASILIFANKILALPSLLFEYAKGDALLIFLMMFAIDIGVLFIFFALKNKYRDKSFFSLLSEKLTRPVAIIIYLALLVYFFLEMMVNFNVTGIYFKTEIYHNDEQIIFIVLTLAIFAVTAAGGFRGLGRTVEFFYYPIIFGACLCLIISFFNFSEPLVLFDSTPKGFFMGAYKHIFSFGDCLILFLLMDKIQYDEKSKKNILCYVLITMGIILFGVFMFLSIFQNTAFLHSSAISDIILLSPEIFSIGRLDIIAVTTVMFLTLCQISIYGFVISDLIKHIIPKLSMKVCIFIVVVVFLLLYAVLIKTADVAIESARSWGIYLAIFVQYVLPVISALFLIGKKKEAET